MHTITSKGSSAKRQTHRPSQKSGTGFKANARTIKGRHTPANHADVIRKVEQKLRGFKDDPIGYVEFMRQVSFYDFSNRARLHNADRRMERKQLLHPLTDKLTIDDNGAFDFKSTLGFWRFKTSHHQARTDDLVSGAPVTVVSSKLPDWEINVSLCDELIVHPMLVNIYLSRLEKRGSVSVADASLWRRTVMQEFQTVATQLIEAYRTCYPNQNLWSYTLCSDSERLLSQLKDVRIKDGLAYVFAQ